jgi:hypothetical protein
MDSKQANEKSADAEGDEECSTMAGRMLQFFEHYEWGSTALMIL